ncbi:MAG: hypothetical protein IKE69_01555 [Thermoguttaceae bacterium]|nr:hypothetical protein [Thermoguttaceae bacterium]
MANKVVILDKTAAVRLYWMRKMDRFAKTSAQEVQRELKGEFVRRSPRKPAKGQGRPLSLYDETGRRVKPMTEFVRELKRDVRGGATLTGKAISTRRQKKAGGQTNAAWINRALKTHDDTPVKTPSAPGQPPFTWRNVNRGKKGHPQSGYPDYFMRSRVRMVQKAPLNYEVFIKQWKSSEAVFKVLEKGGSIAKTKRRLLGYSRIPYTVGSRQRFRIEPKFEKVTSAPNVRARPFLAPVEKKVRKSAVERFKR